MFVLLNMTVFPIYCQATKNSEYRKVWGLCQLKSLHVPCCAPARKIGSCFLFLFFFYGKKEDFFVSEVLKLLWDVIVLYFC